MRACMHAYKRMHAYVMFQRQDLSLKITEQYVHKDDTELCNYPLQPSILCAVCNISTCAVCKCVQAINAVLLLHVH